MKNFEVIQEFVRHTDYGFYLYSLSNGYMSSRIFFTALELNLFSRLGSQNLSASEMSKQLNTDERATEIFLNALVGMGLLQKKDDLYANIEEAAKFLMPGSVDYRGGAYLHAASHWDEWSRLTEIIRSGKSCNKIWTDNKKHGLAIAMMEQARVKAEKVVNAIDLSRASHMLDIGCGPGLYSIAFAINYPNLKIDLFEIYDEALKIAEEEIKRNNLEERINIINGNFLTDDLGHNYDIVLLSSITCFLGEEQNLHLLRKVRDSLNDGGRILVGDLKLDESKTKPASAAIFSVNMLVNTPHGRLYSEHEIQGWLHSLKLKNISSIPVENSLFIVAEK
jgi:predicted O-methyltransferase YrrM